MWVLFVLIGSAMAALGNISLKYGLTQVNTMLPHLSPNLQTIYHLASNLYIWLGLASFGMGFLCWLTGLSQVKLSNAYPVFVGAEYCLVMILSWLVLGELFTPLKIAAIVLIFVGIILIVW